MKNNISNSLKNQSTMERAKSFKAITDKSKDARDLQDVNPKSFNDIASKKSHTEFFCDVHFKDRLLNFCDRDSLVDVLFSGIEKLSFQRVSIGINQDCKCCKNLAEFRIDRVD